jgi:hypothetical protein
MANGPNGQNGSENSYTHVWRSHEADWPCTLTGREGPEPDGQVFVEITREDSVTFVPKDELVTFAAWRDEQARAAKPPALREPDRDQTEIFVEALFRYATPQGFVSLRAFTEDDDKKPFRITPTSLTGGLKFLIDAAMDDARRAAYHFFDPYLKDRERAALERADWHKKNRLRGGAHQNIPLWRGGLAGRKPRPVSLAPITLATTRKA